MSKYLVDHVSTGAGEIRITLKNSGEMERFCRDRRLPMFIKKKVSFTYWKGIMVRVSKEPL